MKKKLLYASALLFVFNFISKILAFVKESILAFYYGSSNITDSYILSQNIIECLFCAITSAIVIGYISIMSEKKEDDNETANSFINIVNLLYLIIIILITFFTEYIVKMFAPGFDLNLVHQTSSMIRIIAPFCIFYSYQYIISANLQTKNVFWHIGIYGILANLSLILSIILSKNRPWLLAIGYGISLLLQAMFVYIVGHKNGFRLKFTLNFKNNRIKKILKFCFPVFFIEIISNIMIIIDKMFASTLGIGGISNLNYANRIITLIVNFFVSIISTVLLPTLVDKANNDTIDKYVLVIRQVFIYVLMIILPITVGVIIGYKDIIKILFMRGAFDPNSAMITSNILRIYAIGLPALALNSIIKSQLYAMKKNKSVLFFVACSILVNIILDKVLMNCLGNYALPIASIISSYVLLVLLIICLQKKVKNLCNQYLAKNILKLLGSLIVMLIAMETIKILNINSSLLNLILYLIFGAISYLAILKLFKFEELNFVLSCIKITNKKKGSK